MIKAEKVTKQYRMRFGCKTVLHDISFTLQRGQKLGILGRNGAGKSTLIRLLSGVEAPSSGKIVRDMSISWPLAFGGGFQGSLTGKDNLRFLCRIYGADIAQVSDFVADFTDLGRYLDEPVKVYSSGMRARLAFALSMAIEFDCFLIDEVLAVGDAKFKEKCKIELFEKRKDRAIILVSHNMNTVKEICDSASVIHAGVMSNFNNIEAAHEFYNAHQDKAW